MWGLPAQDQLYLALRLCVLVKELRAWRIDKCQLVNCENGCFGRSRTLPRNERSRDRWAEGAGTGRGLVTWEPRGLDGADGVSGGGPGRDGNAKEAASCARTCGVRVRHSGLFGALRALFSWQGAVCADRLAGGASCVSVSGGVLLELEMRPRRPPVGVEGPYYVGGPFRTHPRTQMSVREKNPNEPNRRTHCLRR